jgi:hypothetical protein
MAQLDAELRKRGELASDYAMLGVLLFRDGTKQIVGNKDGTGSNDEGMDFDVLVESGEAWAHPTSSRAT